MLFPSHLVLYHLTNIILQASPVALRGITTAGINLGIVIGQLLSNAAVKAFGERNDRWAYRAPFALQLLFVGKLLLAGDKISA